MPYLGQLPTNHEVLHSFYLVFPLNSLPNRAGFLKKVARQIFLAWSSSSSSIIWIFHNLPLNMLENGPFISFYIHLYIYIYIYVRRSKLNSCGEVMASLHKAPYRYTQSQHPFHQLGRIAARRGGSRWGIGFLFPLRWYLQGNSNFYVITKADVDSFS